MECPTDIVDDDSLERDVPSMLCVRSTCQNNTDHSISYVTLTEMSSVVDNIIINVSTSQDKTCNIQYKDQVRFTPNSAMNTIQVGDCCHEIGDDNDDDENICINESLNIENSEYLSSSIHSTQPRLTNFVPEQLNIPMAEAFVVGDELSNRMPRLDIVQLDGAATCMDNQPYPTRTSSAGTRTTDPTSNPSNDNVTMETNIGSDYDNNNNNNNDSNDDNENTSFENVKVITLSAVRNERRFWIRFIVMAIILNTVLVTGIVVAAFCGSGACTRSNHDKDNAFKTTESTPPPTRTLSPSIFFVDDDFTTTDENTTESISDNLTDDPVSTLEPTPVKSTFEPFLDENITNEDTSSGLSLQALIGISVAAEVLIASILLFYYRSWKRNQDWHPGQKGNVYPLPNVQ
jgi:hypothetical protein